MDTATYGRPHDINGEQEPAPMNAIVMQNGALTVRQAPVPRPGAGEALVKVLAVGICGSDLHALKHGSELLAGVKAVSGADLFALDDEIVMGHEFCAEVVEYGPDSRRPIAVGTRVTSAPILLRTGALLGYTGLETPGAYCQYMVLSEDLLIPVPDGVSDDLAALAEPLAVALHAVNRGNLGTSDVPIVIGCGPIGLAVIAVLKMRGLGPIVAADFSPARRALAKSLGADIVVDPRETSPYDSWQSVATAADPADFGRQTTMFPGFAFRPSVVFECVGVPGVIQQILAGAAPCSKVIVAGVCMQSDAFEPTFALFKEIDVVFCMAYTVEEFAEAFSRIASGELQVGALITSHVQLSDVPDAFVRLADPEQDAKIIVVP